jgi:uncharacterized protein YueI
LRCDGRKWHFYSDLSGFTFTRNSVQYDSQKVVLKFNHEEGSDAEVKQVTDELVRSSLALLVQREFRINFENSDIDVASLWTDLQSRA